MTDDFSHSPNPRRLYKSRRHKVLAGVCGGIAEYFDIDVAWVRIGAIVSLFTPISGLVIISYIVAAIVMPRRYAPEKPLTREEDQFWRGVSRRPQATFSNMKYRFRDLDARLADMERVVTSDEWKLRRQFKEIE
ncbi:MAG: envelope stress response membrane protein PspC [Caulobacterales bacterium]|nr:envelope stress response membrane protein PspC [Caulobacterales bacterium]